MSFWHKADVEPGFVRQVEDEFGARFEHRRPDRALGHHVECELAVDAGTFGQEQTPGQREHLYGEADVDGELERQSLPVFADVRRRAELAQDRLDARPVRSRRP
jgi:hypothetical protein